MSNQFARPMVFDNDNPYATPVVAYDADGNPLAFESLEAIRLASEGLIADTWPRRASLSTLVLISGSIYFTPIHLREGQVLTNALTLFNNAGVSVTLGKMGLYTKAGVRLAVTAAQTTAWESTGLKSHALTSPYTVPATDTYYAAMLAVAGTGPAAYRTGTGLAQGAQIGSAMLPWPVQTGQTDLIANATPVAGGTSLWMGFN